VNCIQRRQNPGSAVAGGNGGGGRQAEPGQAERNGRQNGVIRNHNPRSAAGGRPRQAGKVAYSN